jgi:hypothetical protein
VPPLDCFGLALGVTLPHLRIDVYSALIEAAALPLR